MHPLVRMVTVNYDGGDMTLECLSSLLNLDYPADRLEIVLIDNASIDGVADRVRNSMPSVRVIEAFANLGFSGGCNLGIEASGSYDYVGLINNDATVENDWLNAMLRPFTYLSGPRVGATCSKMLFAAQYRGAEIDGPISTVRGRYRTKKFGVRVSGARVGGVEIADANIRWSRGFSPQLDRLPSEPFARWTTSPSQIHTPAGEGDMSGQPLELRLSSKVSITASVTAGREVNQVEISPDPSWFTIGSSTEPYDVIQNAGSGLFRNGFGGDRGFLTRDLGQFDAPSEVFAWCGGAVLLSKQYLDDVGHFDENLFLYYEDTDLSWRGRLKGWSYWYEPTAIVRHRHAASTVAGSPLFRYQVDRNRLLTLVKSAPRSLIKDAIVLEIGLAIASVVFDVMYPIRHLRRPRFGDLKHRAAVAKGVLRWLPDALRIRKQSKESTRKTVTARWLGVDA